MPHEKKTDTTPNPDWEREIAKYDSARAGEDREFRSHHLLIPESGNPNLTVEENEVFNCILRGLPPDEVAEMYGVEVGVITGLCEIIRAKLSLPE